ncbi:MAG: HAD-IIA family hydrolase [Kofleriaceae bacterium]|nr:HAD-IIA family hydrolase [Kofleriaceae bacterium]
MSSPAPTSTQPDPVALARLRQARGFLLDMDGTIYIDEVLVPGARELLAWLVRHDRRFVFVTNNSSARARDYLARLARLGIEVAPSQVITSGDATISYLLRHTPHRSAYVVGTPGFVDECRDQGLDVDAADPDCVVVGFDKTLTFAKLERACTLLFAGKPYYATHPDKTCITTHGLIPDIAAIIAACEAVTGRTPKIIGKPYPEMVDAACARIGVAIDDAVIVGDQLDTDMAMAHASGTLGVLVMTGETLADAWTGQPGGGSPGQGPGQVTTGTPPVVPPAPMNGRRLTARGVEQVWKWLESAGS